MFNFFKKSCAVKFLCSSCLSCSLGTFAISANDTQITNIPGKIGENQYVQGAIGFGLNHIGLDGTTMDSSGLMSGSLKWKTTKTQQKIDDNGNKLYSKGTLQGTETRLCYICTIIHPVIKMTSCLIWDGSGMMIIILN